MNDTIEDYEFNEEEFTAYDTEQYKFFINQIDGEIENFSLDNASDFIKSFFTKFDYAKYIGLEYITAFHKDDKLINIIFFDKCKNRICIVRTDYKTVPQLFNDYILNEMIYIIKISSDSFESHLTGLDCACIVFQEIIDFEMNNKKH